MMDRSQRVPIKTVARWFINHADREAGEAITPLKLQKLVYYAQAWHLANFDRPLFGDNFEAWAHGPANRALYAKYRDYGWEALPLENGANPPDDVSAFLRGVFDTYGQYSAKKLEQMTHEEEPWVEVRGDLPPEAASRSAMSNLSMRNYYGKRIGKKEIEKLPN